MKKKLNLPNRGPGDTSADALIEHADRCWEAECENARRVAEQRKLLAAAIVGLLGLGLYKVEWLRAVDHVSRLHVWHLDVAVKLFLMVALYRFTGSLVALYRRTDANASDAGTKGLTASEKLAFRHKDRAVPVKRAIASRTYRAYLELQKRNVSQWIRLQKAQRLFGQGFLCVILALAMYIVGSVPPVLTKDTKGHERDRAANDPDCRCLNSQVR